MVVFVADKDALASPAHSVLCVVLLESLQAGKNRGILFRLPILCPKCVIAQGIKADRFRLIGVEFLRYNRSARVSGCQNTATKILRTDRSSAEHSV